MIKINQCITAIYQQESADVVACNRDPATDMVEALDTWNTVGFNNIVDAIQDVESFLRSYSGGRIRCRYTVYTIH